MNIIQLQDRLKGVPDEALVGYVQNPTGDVPTYLALGELQRRKDMRERYQADKQPEPSVAEQLIEETKPQGIAGMAPGMAPPAQGVGAPQPQPEMTPDMMASSGVGALPAGAVGQNYAGGGIVAFAAGDYVPPPKGFYMDRPAGGYLSPDEYRMKLVEQFSNLPSDLSNIRKSIEMQNIYTTGDTPYDAAIDAYTRIGDTSSVDQLRKLRKDFIQFSDPYISQDVLAAKTDPLLSYDMPEEGITDQDVEDVKKITQESLVKKEKPKVEPKVESVAEADIPELNFDTSPANKPLVTPVIDTEDTYDPFKDFYRPEGDEVVTDADARFRKLIGEDPAQARMQERLKKYEDRQRKMEDTAIGEALMAAGFGMMAGTSPHALENVGKGAQAGLERYGQSRKDIMAMEEKAFGLDMELAKATRAEQLAAAKYGLDSEQYNKAHNDKIKLEQIKGEYDLRKYETLSYNKLYKDVSAAKKNKQVALEALRKSKDFATYKDYITLNDSELDKILDQKGFTDKQKRDTKAVVKSYRDRLAEINKLYPLADIDLSTLVANTNAITPYEANALGI
jgi:hypothetical protein